MNNSGNNLQAQGAVSNLTPSQQQQQSQAPSPQSPRVVRGTMRKQNAISVTLTPDMQENLINKLCDSTMANANNNNNNNVNSNYSMNEISAVERRPSSAAASQSSVLLGQELQPQHLKPRKSLLGSGLERSSFQTQRLSDVGVAFGQQITAKMGLKLPASQERIVEQTRKLYLKYVFFKLRQNSLPLRDLNLTKSSRARRNMASQDNVPKIVCSAPASAVTLTDFTNSPFKLPKILTTTPTSSDRRRATAISHDFNKQELSLLTSRLIINSKLNNLSESNSNLSNSNTSLNNLLESNSNILSTLDSQVAKKYVTDSTINNQIFMVIVNIISELRELKPDFYGDTIYEHVGIDKFASLENLLTVQLTICQEMTRSEISWCRICALFSLIGSISLDCVRLGAPEHVGPLMEGFIEFVEKDLALWISQQGGWESFLYKYRASSNFTQLKSITLIVLIVPISLWAFKNMFW